MKKIVSVFVFSLALCGFLSFNISRAEATTLYFNAGTDNDWNTLTNWWTDAGFTQQAGSLPGVGDDVIVSGNVTSNSGVVASVNTMTVNGSASISINITVANSSTFNGSSAYQQSSLLLALNQGINPQAMTAAPNGNVYAAIQNGDIYMQTNGTGNFVALSQTSRQWRSMTAAQNGNIYAADYGGDIYMQTNGSGNFVALGQTHRDWSAMAAAPNGNIYAAVFGGDIYMQTNGTGNFVALGQSGSWDGMAASSNGNIYASAGYTDIFMQTNGTGNFVALNAPKSGGFGLEWGDMAADSNGNVYVIAGSCYNNIYVRVNDTGNFVSTNHPGGCSHGYISLAATPDGDLYVTQNNVDIFKQSNNAMTGDASFLDSTSNHARVNGNACFASTATNTGTVTGSTSVCTTSSAPVVSTAAASNISFDSVQLNGSVDDTGGESANPAGFQYGLTDSYGSTATYGTSAGGSFSSSVSSLTCETTYHFRAFATNSVGTSYGQDAVFVTGSCTGSTYYFNGVINSNWSTLGNWWSDANFTVPAPHIPSAIDDAVVTNNIYSNSGSAASVKTLTVNNGGYVGISIAVADGMIINDTSVNGGTITGDVSFYDSTANYGTITGSACFASTATNSGTVTGTVTVCSISLPTITTVSDSAVITSMRLLRGSIVNTGGESVAAGFEYGLDTNYGTTVSKSGLSYSGTFSVLASSLVCDTTYHYKAFATNSAGTSHGGDATFTTDSCSAQAQTLYGIDGAGPNPSPPNLYTIDPSTGNKLTAIGLVGYNVVGMAFDPTDGTLYGTTGGADSTGGKPKSLIRINKTTGAGTWLGTIKDSGNNSMNMPDISFRSDGVLFGIGSYDSNLYTIDVTSCNGSSDTNCLATKIGSAQLGNTGNGLAFDSSDELYLFPDEDDDYFQINPDTGASISNPDFSNPSGESYAIKGATFNKNNALFAARLNYGDPSPNDLIIIDLSTHTIISTGDNSAMRYMSALAFAPVAPVLTTVAASSITQTSLISGGNITNSGGETVTARGVVWDTSASPTIALSTKTSDGTGIGTFASSITGLTNSTTYYIRAYATNGIGTSYGNEVTININPVPTLTTISPTTVVAGSNQFSLTVTGTNFVSDSVINWNGTPLTTSYTSPTTLSSLISAQNILSPHTTANITVTNTTPGGGTTDSLPLSITILNQGGGGYTPPIKPIIPPVTNPIIHSNPSLRSGPSASSFLSKPSACTLTLTLRQGSKGEQVKCLQTKLNLLTDGKFGPKTKASVIIFQKAHSLVPDGVVGRRTRAILNM